MTNFPAENIPVSGDNKFYNRLLLLVAGLGGLLFGIDVGIISGALPYMEATSGLNADQLSFIVAAVYVGSATSTLFAGALADLVGRKKMMTLSGILFVVGVPIIACSHGYGTLIWGRILQGISGGLIGVVAPLYLAECLSSTSRGKGTGIFQWLLTLGIAVAAAIGLYFSSHVANFTRQADAVALHAYEDAAWRNIFWVSLPPGIFFVVGSLLVSESPRWLYRRGRHDAALRALLRSRSPEQAQVELREIELAVAAEKSASNVGKSRESLLQRKYLVPFFLAVIILACNQATGVNSIISYNATMLIQAGLNDQQAHFGSFLLTIINFLMTIVAVVLVDRKGRKFLLSLGSGGVIVSLFVAGFLFRSTESRRVDVRDAMQAFVASDQTAQVKFTPETAAKLLAGREIANQPVSMVIIYSYGDFHAATKTVRSDDPSAQLTINRTDSIPATKVAAFFKNPFADLDAARTAPLRVDNAIITPIPSVTNGWLTAVCAYCFMAFFAIGPGVCVWLALSELMPTRIRSNGMSIALLINTGISMTIAGIFLPTVGQYGYSSMFFVFGGCTVIYFITAAFFLPETKGKTLEEIEASFVRR